MASVKSSVQNRLANMGNLLANIKCNKNTAYYTLAISQTKFPTELFTVFRLRNRLFGRVYESQKR